MIGTGDRTTRLVRLAAALVIAAGVVIGLLASLVTSADAVGTSAGLATITTGDFSTPLASGGSATDFSILLPAQAHCTGDTANNGFTYYGYIVPKAVDPGTLTFNSAVGPSQGFPLVDNGGVPFEARNTAPNTGQIYPTGPPTFNYLVFTTAQLTPGDYNVGIECANKGGLGDVFWNVVETITANAADKPGGFTWTAANPTVTTTTTTSTTGATTTSTTAGGTTTTSTTASGTSTTSTTADPSATTTTSSTVGGTTTTSSPTTTTTTVPPAGTSPTNAGQLAVTGSRPMSQSEWALVLVIVGVITVLATRRRDLDDDHLHRGM